MELLFLFYGRIFLLNPSIKGASLLQYNINIASYLPLIFQSFWFGQPYALQHFISDSQKEVNVRFSVAYLIVKWSFWNEGKRVMVKWSKTTRHGRIIIDNINIRPCLLLIIIRPCLLLKIKYIFVMLWIEFSFLFHQNKRCILRTSRKKCRIMKKWPCKREIAKRREFLFIF